MNKVSESIPSTYSLIRNNVDLMTVAGVTLVALAVIVLLDTLPFGVGSSLLEAGAIVCCSAALVIEVKEIATQKKLPPSSKPIEPPPIPSPLEMSSDDDLLEIEKFPPPDFNNESRDHLNFMNSATLVACLQASLKRGGEPVIYTDPAALLDQGIPVPTLFDPFMKSPEPTTIGSVRGKLIEPPPSLDIKRDLATIDSFLQPPLPKKLRSPRPVLRKRETRDFAPLKEAVLRIVTMGEKEAISQAKERFEKAILPKYEHDSDYIQKRASLIGQPIPKSNDNYGVGSFVIATMEKGIARYALVTANYKQKKELLCTVSPQSANGEARTCKFPYSNVQPCREDLSVLAERRPPLDPKVLAQITLPIDELAREGKEEIRAIYALFDTVKPLPLEEDDKKLLFNAFLIEWEGNFSAEGGRLTLGGNITGARVPANKEGVLGEYLQRRGIKITVKSIEEPTMTIKLKQHRRAAKAQRPSILPSNKSSTGFIGPVHSAHLLVFLKRNPKAPELVSQKALLQEHIPSIGGDNLWGEDGSLRLPSESFEDLMDNSFLNPSKPEILKDIDIVTQFPKKPKTQREKERKLDAKNCSLETFQTSLLRVLRFGEPHQINHIRESVKELLGRIEKIIRQLNKPNPSVPPDIPFDCAQEWVEREKAKLAEQKETINKIMESGVTSWKLSNKDKPLYDSPFPVIFEINGSKWILGQGIQKAYTTRVNDLQAFMQHHGLNVEVVGRAFLQRTVSQRFPELFGPKNEH